MSSVKVKSNGNGTLFPKLLNEFFDTNVFERPGLLGFDGGLRGIFSNIPSVNITENDRDFKIEMAAPGLDKKDFKIEVENGTLTISSEKEEEKEVEKKNYSRKEFSYRSFSRSFDLPDNSVPDKIEAAYENGILRLVLPKKEVSVSGPKKEIKIG